MKDPQQQRYGTNAPNPTPHPPGPVTTSSLPRKCSKAADTRCPSPAAQWKTVGLPVNAEGRHLRRGQGPGRPGLADLLWVAAALLLEVIADDTSGDPDASASALVRGPGAGRTGSHHGPGPDPRC